MNPLSFVEFYNFHNPIQWVIFYKTQGTCFTRIFGIIYNITSTTLDPLYIYLYICTKYIQTHTDNLGGHKLPQDNNKV